MYHDTEFTNQYTVMIVIQFVVLCGLNKLNMNHCLPHIFASLVIKKQLLWELIQYHKHNIPTLQCMIILETPSRPTGIITYSICM